MNRIAKIAQVFFTLLFVASLSLQGIQPAAAQDDGHPRIKRHSQTGKVSFLGTEPGRPIHVPGAQAPGLSQPDKALAMIQPYAADFGLKQAKGELKLQKAEKAQGRQVTRFQQTYQGIPVMAGELVVNATDQGELISIDGEISPDLSLDLRPSITAQQAETTALESLAKWKNGKASDFQAGRPELWIYDARLLQPDGSAPSVVWRMDVTSRNPAEPLRELVLVDAHRGNIALHFNQVPDASSSRLMTAPDEAPPESNPTATEPATEAAPALQANPAASLRELPALSGTTRYVATSGADSGDCTDSASPCLTMNYAIGQAAAGDTIKVAAGTYTRSGSSPVVSVTRRVVLSGGWNAAFATQDGYSAVDGQGSRPGVSIIDGISTVTISHFIVENGYASGQGGGGIQASSSLILEHSIVRNNQAVGWPATGAGIHARELIINNSYVTGNHAHDPSPSSHGAGGGIFAYSLTMSNSTVSNNSVQAGYLAEGAGIHVSFDYGIGLILNNSTISNNSAEGGDSADGGGIWMLYQNPTQSVIINNSTIVRNSVWANRSATGGGFSIRAGQPVIRNTILTQNTTSDLGPNCFFNSSGLTTDHDLLGDMSYCYSTTSTGNVGGDPMLLPIFAEDRAFFLLFPGSPAINAGNPVTCLATDQRGVVRPQGTACDIGAIESGATGTTPVHLLGYGSQYIYLNSAARIAPTALVLDENYNAVPGIGVTFSAPGSEPSGIFSNGTHMISALTNISGVATSGAFVASATEGAYAITITADGIALPLSFSLKNGSADIRTYTMAHGFSDYALPGTPVCDLTDYECTNGANPDGDRAESYGLGVYEFYRDHFQRRSLDDAGTPIILSVQYGIGFNNAMWYLGQGMFGDGWPTADDVIGHEITHGVTDYESGLYNYFQSGAISESLSDIFGELYDRSNEMGTDTSSAEWLVGEDLPGGAIRLMSDPPAMGDPDKMSSSLYDFDLYEDDSGGVHANSGINNKAAYLLVDGDTFNGKTVSALGADKTLAIYYEVNTHLLTSGSDYADLYVDLYQACLNLVGGSAGITLNDCQSVQNAVDAVEMNLQPAAGYNAEAPQCSAGSVPINLFLDGLESGAGNWAFSNTRWQWDSAYGPFAHSGLHFLYGDDYPDVVTDTKVAMKTAVAVPASAYLHFAHAFDFQSNGGGAPWYDGGVLEYSVNNGLSWSDTGSLIDYNGYRGLIYTGSHNPLAGRWGFVGTSHGYISTRLNLSSLAGKSVKFRWRMGLDEAGYSWGWWLDDVRIYTCQPPVTISGNTGMSGVLLRYTDETPKTAVSQTDGSYSLQVSSHWSGSVTPYYAHYTFQPAGRSYTNLTSNQTNQDFTAFANNTDIFIGGPKAGDYYVGSGGRVTPTFYLQNGPVHVVTQDASNIFTSQRVHNGNGFVNELMGFPNNQLTNEYWFPWYDNLGMQSWILVGNPSTSAIAHVTVNIAGTDYGPYDIGPGEVKAKTYPLMNGPVHITSNINVFASERVATGQGFVQETMGYPNNQLNNEYWFPWYDNLGMASWILVGNPSATDTAHVTINIVGTDYGPYDIEPGGRITPRFPVMNGPVHVTSDINVFASERVHGMNGFVQETMGYPNNRLTKEYWFPWYDNLGMMSWILVGNPSTTDTAHVTVTIAGAEMAGSPFTILPGDRITPRFGVMNGPVHVSSDINVFTSERVHTGQGFVQETMGYPNNRLAAEYWFPWYDNITTMNWVLVGKP